MQTALRQNANLDDNSVLTMLPADTLLYLNGQSTVNNVVWSGAQTRLGTAYIGLVQDNAVRRITEAEAKTIIDAYDAAHATATPTASPSPSPVPAQLYRLLRNPGRCAHAHRQQQLRQRRPVAG